MAPTKSPNAEKERAKRIIVEIIRQNGGAFRLKTNLYKAFYYAHLEYAKNSTGYLSEWPIVRMPNGPGIHYAGKLLNELISEGILDVQDGGDYEGFSFALRDKAESLPPMLPDEIEAIKHGLECVEGMTARDASEESHITSRSWQGAKNGEELNIYADLSDDQRFEERRQFLRRVGPQMAELLGEQ